MRYFVFLILLNMPRIASSQSITLDSVSSFDHLRHTCLKDTDEVVAYFTVHGTFKTDNFFNLDYRGQTLAIDQTPLTSKLTGSPYRGFYPSEDGPIRIISTSPADTSNAITIYVNEPNIYWGYQETYSGATGRPFSLRPTIYPYNAHMHWEFGTSASPASSDSSRVEVTFSTAGHRWLKYRLSSDCGTISDSIGVNIEQLGVGARNAEPAEFEIHGQFLSLASVHFRRLRIMTALGVTVKTIDIETPTLLVNLSGLSSGAYYLMGDEEDGR